MKNRIKPDRKAFASNGTPQVKSSEDAPSLDEELEKPKDEPVKVLQKDKTKAKVQE